jgi:hypothetical protein
MTGPIEPEVEIRERLRQVEGELRRWRRGAVVFATLALLSIAGAMAAPQSKELRVQTLRIVDDAGKDRIILTAEPKIPDMTFLDPSGQGRLTLDIAEDHKPVLVVSDSGKESTRLTLGIEGGSPLLQLYDATVKKRIAFGVPKEGGSMIRVLDADGKLRSKFP